MSGLHPMSGPISGTAPLKEASSPQRDGTCRTLDAGYNIYAPTYTTYTHPICVYVVSHLRAIVRPRIGRGSLPPPPFPLPCPCQFFWESEAETRRLWSVYDSKSPSKVYFPPGKSAENEKLFKKGPVVYFFEKGALYFFFSSKRGFFLKASVRKEPLI